MAVLGFVGFVAAELLPWGTVHMSSGPDTIVRAVRGPYTNGQGISLDQIQSFELVTYHVGALALFGAIGLGLAGAATRRRAAMGAAVGVAAGLFLTILSLYHTMSHYFASAFYGDLGPNSETDLPTVATGPGAYVAFAAVAFLAASAVVSGLYRPPVHRPVAEPAPAIPAGRAPAEDQRDLTVSAMEPFDEAYFARPDTR
jgi:hypothetical protein